MANGKLSGSIVVAPSGSDNDKLLGGTHIYSDEEGNFDPNGLAIGELAEKDRDDLKSIGKRVVAARKKL